MKQHIIETLMGALVILVALSFVFIAYKSGNITNGTSTYPLIAKFNEVGSISIGSDVRVGGIKVGTVAKQTLEDKTYRAVLEMDVKQDIQLPRDSSAAIVSDGLIGNKYVSIIPGADEEMLAPEEEILYTQDSVSLEALIGKFAFGSLKEDENKDAKDEDNFQEYPDSQNSNEEDSTAPVDESPSFEVPGMEPTEKSEEIPTSHEIIPAK